MAKKTNTLAEDLAELDLYIKINMARNPNTPAEALAELAKDEDWRVRINAANNPPIRQKKQ